MRADIQIKHIVAVPCCKSDTQEKLIALVTEGVGSGCVSPLYIGHCIVYRSLTWPISSVGAFRV